MSALYCGVHQRRGQSHPRVSSLILLAGIFLALLAASPAAADTVQCFGISGQKSSGTPCNTAATGQPGGLHASCCDASKQEACLATGLCYAAQRSDNTSFWAEGCTDPTGLDPSCPQYCGTASQFVSAPLQTAYTMLFCGSGAWCCCFESFGKSCNKADCCARNFTLARGLGAVVRQFSNNGDVVLSGNGSVGAGAGGSGSTNGTGGPGGTFGPRGDRRQSLITAIVSGVLGSLLLASLVAVAFSVSRARHLRQQVDDLLLLTKDGGGDKRSSSTPTASLASRSPRSHTLSINTQGLGGVGSPQQPPSAPPRLSTTITNKDEVFFSPVSYEQQAMHAGHPALGVGIARTSMSSIHQPQPQHAANTFNYAQQTPQQQQPPQTPTWAGARQGSFSQQSIDGTMAGMPMAHAMGKAELSNSAQVSELPAERYTG